MARIAAFALDQFDHGAFFAADVGAGAPAHVDFCVLCQARRLEFGQFDFQDLAHGWVFIAHVNEDLLRLDRPGGDQHALEKIVRLALQIVAVLERAGLPLVAIDRHQPRPRLGTHQAPLASGWKAGATEAAQAAVRERLNDRVRRALAAQTGLQDGIASPCLVGRKILEGRELGLDLARAGQRQQRGRRGVIDVAMSNLGGGSRGARADAGRTHHPHAWHLPRQVLGRERGKELFRSGQHAAQAVADANRDWRGLGLAIANDVEMGIKGRDLVDFRHRNREFLGQGVQVARRQGALLVLD